MQNTYSTGKNKFAEVRKLGYGYHQVNWFGVTPNGMATRTSISYCTNRRELHKTLRRQEQAYAIAKALQDEETFAEITIDGQLWQAFHVPYCVEECGDVESGPMGLDVQPEVNVLQCWDETPEHLIACNTLSEREFDTMGELIDAMVVVAPLGKWKLDKETS